LKTEKLDRFHFNPEYREFQKQNIFNTEVENKKVESEDQDPFDHAKRDTQYMEMRIALDKENMRIARQNREYRLFKSVRNASDTELANEIIGRKEAENGEAV
jgi:hypothetical protein